MQTFLFFALALVVRTLPSVDGTADCTLKSGQRLVAAYSAEFEPVWHHAVPSTVIDRMTAARTGRVTGLHQNERLVLAVEDDNAAFDASHPLRGNPDTFPYSPDFVRQYESDTGRTYVRDMMAVVAPFLGSQQARSVAVTELYETLFAAESATAAPRTFGAGSSSPVLVVSSRARAWCWLDRKSGDDGTAYAESLAKRGYCADLTDGGIFTRLSVDDDGFVTGNGRRYETMVLRHLSHRDADGYRRTFGNRPLKTKVFATDTPILYGPELTWADPVLPAK